jgi:outer membrane protein assembly factor BamD (BamD/ComL family)
MDAKREYSMKRTTMTVWRTIATGLAALAMAAGDSNAANILYYKTGGEPQKADRITYKPSTQEYVVEFEGTIIPIAKARVDHLEIDKPADFDKAVQAIGAGQADAGIAALETIVTKYNMLVWDNAAREVLGRAYLKKDPKKAVEVLDALFANLPKTEIQPETHLLYWQCLLAAGRGATLKKELDDVIATGTRDMAAAAQIMRGDVNKSAGLKEDALLDYLRTVILFENVRAVQPEALFKASQMLDELRDPRADELRKKLVQEYPKSEFAQQAGARL